MTISQARPIRILSQVQHPLHQANKQSADPSERVVVFVPNLWPDPKRRLRRLMAYLNVRQRLSDWVDGLISGAAAIR